MTGTSNAHIFNNRFLMNCRRCGKVYSTKNYFKNYCGNWCSLISYFKKRFPSKEDKRWMGNAESIIKSEVEQTEKAIEHINKFEKALDTNIGEINKSINTLSKPETIMKKELNDFFTPEECKKLLYDMFKENINKKLAENLNIDFGKCALAVDLTFDELDDDLFVIDFPEKIFEKISDEEFEDFIKIDDDE